MKYNIFVVLAATIVVQSQFINVKDSNICNDDQYVRPDIFQVEGHASKLVSPTKATVRLGIETLEPSADQALAKAASIMDNCVLKLQALKLDGIKIQTKNFQISPSSNYRYDHATQENILVSSGYKVTNEINVETKEHKSVGKIIDTAVKEGANRVNQVYFGVEGNQKQEIADELIDVAIQDAQKKARIVLKELNMKIAGIKSVQVLENNYGPSSESEDLNFQKSVMVGFVIKPIE